MNPGNAGGGKGLGVITLEGKRGMGLTEPKYSTDTKLKRIAYLSSRDKHKQYTSLMHHYNDESLKECFNHLDGKRRLE